MAKTTTRDIAKSLGISQSAVSIALRGQPGVSEATRKRVMEKAEALGYRPNALVQALMANLRNKVSTEAELPLACFIHAPTFPTAHRWIRSGMESMANKLGYRIEYMTGIGTSVPIERALKIVQARGIRGVILSPKMDSAQFGENAFDGLAVSSFNYSGKGRNMHRSIVHHSVDMETALEKVFALGFNRPGFLSTKQSEEEVLMRRSARFLITLWKRGMPSEDAVKLLDLNELKGSPTPARMRNALASSCAQWLDSYEPDCILSADSTSLQVIDEVYQSENIWTPIACLNIWWSHDHISGIRQALGNVAAQTVQLVVEQINLGLTGYPETPKTVLIPGKWVEGKSLSQQKIELFPFQD